MPASDLPASDLPNADVLAHIVDVHCHPTDAPTGVSSDSMHRLRISICAMSSMQSDQDKVKALASAYPEKVTPAFGYHPWFSHLISTTDSASPGPKEQHYRVLFFPNSQPANRKNESPTDSEREAQFQALLASLPNPRPLSSIISEVRSSLSSFPNAMLGEVGLDRAFRVPEDFFASPRVLTPFTIPLEHQLAVFEAQMDLAIELGRNVSIHSVKSQQATIELFARMKAKHGERWNRISIDMHSCGLSAQMWRDVEKKYENVFLSLSTVINYKHPNHRDLIANCSPDRILVESDYNDINLCTSQTWNMVKIVAEVRGWPIESEWAEDDDLKEEKWGVVRRVERNWLRFKKGHHPVAQKKKRNKRKDYDSEGSDAQQIGD